MQIEKRKPSTYQQNTWPQGVAVGEVRLLRQSVHLLIPLTWDWEKQSFLNLSLPIFTSGIQDINY